MTSLALGLLRVGLDWPYVVAVCGGGSSAFFTILSNLSVNAYLVWKIYQGRNWARITFLVIFTIGLVPYAYILRTEMRYSLVWGILSAVQGAMQAYAIALMFTSPGKDSFKARNV